MSCVIQNYLIYMLLIMKNFDNAKFESIKAFATVNLVQSEVSDIWMLFP